MNFRLTGLCGIHAEYRKCVISGLCGIPGLAEYRDLQNNLILRNTAILRNNLILRKTRSDRIPSDIIICMWSVYSISLKMGVDRKELKN